MANHVMCSLEIYGDETNYRNFIKKTVVMTRILTFIKQHHHQKMEMTSISGI